MVAAGYSIQPCPRAPKFKDALAVVSLDRLIDMHLIVYSFLYLTSFDLGDSNDPKVAE